MIPIPLFPSEEVISISVWKEIRKAYRYELKPTKKQEVILNKTIGICRHLYNLGLEQKKKAYENGKWSISCYEQINQLPELRQKCTEFNDVYAQILQNVIRRIDTTYQNFFRRVKNNNTDSSRYEKPGFPRFKGYGRYDSFTFPQYGYGCNIVDKKGQKDDKGDIIKLSKIGNIKFIKHRELEGVVKIVTIKKEVDKFFVVFVCQQYIEVPSQKQYTNIEELNQKSIGIDMGLSNLATLSNGKKIEPPKYLRESEKILAKHQRRLARKQRDEKEIIDDRESKRQKKEIKKKIKVNSKNREKERIKVAKIHRTIVNQRRNFNHEVSRTLVNNFDLISFEKLSIQNMVKNHRLAKSISDASWYQLQMFTSYKAEWAGKIVEFVDPKYTSQNCSRCGKLIGRFDETFECPFCNLSINVHVNASINIRDRSTEYQNRLKLTKEITPATGGRACLNSPEVKDVMIQETLSDKGETEDIENTILQAPPFRTG